jgi:hypothetical protein
VQSVATVANIDLDLPQTTDSHCQSAAERLLYCARVIHASTHLCSSRRKHRWKYRLAAWPRSLCVSDERIGLLVFGTGLGLRPYLVGQPRGHTGVISE